MPGLIPDVALLIEARCDPVWVIKGGIGGSVKAFCARHGLRQDVVSSLINGSAPYPAAKARIALATELGVERSYLDELLARIRLKKLGGSNAGS